VNEVLFGTTLPQFSGDVDGFERAAKQARELGFDSVWVFDHLWPLSGGKERPILESWTTLAWLAERTEMRIGTLVTRSSLRSPAVLAHMASTVAALAPGRLTIAIGSGDEKSRAENEAFGLPYWEGEERVAQLASTVEVVRAHLQGETVTATDRFVDIDGLPPGPPSTPRPVLWVAGRTDDALDVAARLADGWNGWGGTVERFRQDAANVVAMAGDREVELTWAGIVRDEGSATVLAEGVIEAGARHVILTPPNASAPDAYEALGRILARLR